MYDLLLKLCPEWVTYTDSDKFMWIMFWVVGPICGVLYFLILWLDDVFYELGEKREYKKYMTQRENKGPTMEDCETFHDENLFANIQITKEELRRIEERKALLDTVTKSGSWVNTPASDSPVLEELQLIDYHEFMKLLTEEKAKHTWFIHNAPTNEPKEIEPVKCKCCGASINLAKMVCEYCDTPYERR